jgi:hypothetical protein
MIEFVALNALAMLLLGLTILVSGYLLAGLSWVVVRVARRRLPPGTAAARDDPPTRMA